MVGVAFVYADEMLGQIIIWKGYKRYHMKMRAMFHRYHMTDDAQRVRESLMSVSSRWSRPVMDVEQTTSFVYQSFNVKVV